MKQVQAHLRKNWLEKKRNGCGTFCECFSHLFIMILLAWGYSLSKVVRWGDRDYSMIDFSVPPPFVEESGGSSTGGSNIQINPLELVKFVDGTLRGPLRIPTLETFLSIGVSTRDALGAGDDFPFELFAETSYGLRLRNIIFEGSLHFAPASSETESLIAHLRANCPTIESAEMSLTTHTDEDSAIEYILDNPNDNVLALIVLHQVSPYKVNYDIRMQYATLPNTNRILRRSALGFGSEYQMYYFSGFFSIQRAVDEWAWQYTGAVPVALANASVSAGVAEYVDPTGAAGLLPQQTSLSCAKPDAFLFPFPVPGYTENPFYSRVGFLLGLGLVMATLYPMSRLTKGLVEEKETKLREVMKIMGMTECAHQLAWLLCGVALFLWIACSSTLVTTTSFIKNSDKVIILLFFVLFCLSEVTFSMLLATFFSNSKLASIAAPALLFSTILPRYIFFNTNDEELWLQKYFTSLLSPSAFAFGADTIARYEYGNLGVQWSNIEDGTYSFGGSLRMLAFDFVLYGLLTAYFDRVLPNEYGSRLPPLFFLSANYWFPGRVRTKDLKGPTSRSRAADSAGMSGEEGAGSMDCESVGTGPSTHQHRGGGSYTSVQAIEVFADEGVMGLPEFTDGGTAEGNIEVLDSSLAARSKVCIHGLRKRYSNGKLALRSLSAALVEGQITCLLGANGAGKSTTIGLLTGLVEASAGDVSIYGHSLRQDLAQIRQLTGICPQQNVIVPVLTVREHLEIFAAIKGLANLPGDRKMDRAVRTAVEEVGLVDKLDTAAAALSGGMKRKLCLAIALIGDPKFVLLDEPTSGMDPYSRRSTWEMLLKHKAGRVMVLTTHFMEEAENLGDRILIMSDGALRCSGSGLFLKNRYGAGYVLSLAREKQGLSRVCDKEAGAGHNAGPVSVPVAGDEQTESKAEAETVAVAAAGGAGADPGLEALTAAVTGIVPGAALSSAAAGEAIYSLPLQATAQFAELFSFFEGRAAELGLGVTSYGISITTLEQVFVRLATEAKDADGIERGDVSDDYDEGSTFWGRLGASIRGAVSSLPSAHPAQHQQQRQRQRQPGPSDQVNMEYTFSSKPTPSSSPRGQSSLSLGAVIEGGFLGVGGSGTGPVDEEEGTAMVKLAQPWQGQGQGQAPTIAMGALLGDESESEETKEGVGGSPVEPSGEVEKVTSVADEGDAEEEEEEEEEEEGAGKGEEKLASALVSDYHNSGGADGLIEGDISSGWELCWIQYQELLRKRLIIASRDFKGLFFQIIFPTMQVLFVLAVLMISYSPAGRTVKMSAVTIDKALAEATPELLVAPNLGATSSAGGDPAHFLEQPLRSNPYVSVLGTDPSVSGWPEGEEPLISRQVSEYLLHTGKLEKEQYDHPFRFGSFVFNDSVTLNTTVNWDWVRDNLEFLIENQEALSPFFEATGVDLDLTERFAGDPITVGNFTLDFDFANNTVLVSEAGSSSRRLTAAASASTSASAAASTEPLPLPLPLPRRQQQQQRRRLQTLGQLVGDNATVDEVVIGGVTINASAANTALLQLVEGLSANISAALNGSANATFSLSQADVLRTLLPTGVVEYRVLIDSPYTVIFNTSSPHGAGAFHGELLSEAFEMCSPLRKYSGGNAGIHGTAPHSIPTPVYLPKNHPLPVSRQQALEIRLILSVLAALFILIPLCYAPAAFVAFLVREKESKSKHLQTISGVSPHLYWLATLTWDLALYCVLSLLLICCFFVYGNQSVYVSTGESAAATFLLILLYGFSVIPLCYLYSFLFSNHSTAQISIMAINFGTGFIAVLAILIMQSLPETEGAAKVLVNVFRFFPPYLIGEGFINLAYAFYVNLVGVAGPKLSYFAWRVTGRCLTFMAMEAGGYFALVQLSESRVYRRCRAFMKSRSVNIERLRARAGGRGGMHQGQEQEEDEDVARERRRLAEGRPEDFSLYVSNLEKAYPPPYLGSKAKYAVRGVSFGLQDEERFGLLGVNGAGKTTTLSMLTGEHEPSAGELAVGGVSVYHPDFVKKLGFCPQVDPLLELMTAYETLFFFGRIRGIPVQELCSRVDSLVKQVGLFKHAHRPCGTYSGGNKRKLSLAVALIGNPRVLLLDEPSTGMDPEARRGMWSAIEQVSVGRSIVLVSHSMEECEALCTRIGIMVSGRMQCLGSSQHIKTRFGAGYQIEARVASVGTSAHAHAHAHARGGEEEGEAEPCGVDAVTKCLGAVISADHLHINEKHGGYIRYSVDSAHLDLAQAFACFEENKQRLGVLDYAISQASLEQIFIQFAAEQEEEAGSRALNGLEEVQEGHSHDYHHAA